MQLLFLKCSPAFRHPPGAGARKGFVTRRARGAQSRRTLSSSVSTTTTTTTTATTTATPTARRQGQGAPPPLVLPNPAAVRAWLTGHAGPDPDLASAGEPYEFSAAQEVPFRALVSSMAACARAYATLAATAAAHGLFLASGLGAGHGPPPPGALAVAAAEAAQAAAVACVLWISSAGFAQVAATRGADMAWLLTGLRDLAGAMGEVAIMGTGLALLHVGVAAAAWPGGALPLVAALTAAATLGRAATHGRPDRVGLALRAPSRAMRLLTAPLRAVSRHEAARRRVQQSGRPSPTSLPPRPPIGTASLDLPAGSIEAEREFNSAEEQPLAACIAALHLACLARLLQAAAEAVLCVACAATGRGGEAVLAAVGALETAASGGLFYFSTTSLRAVITTSGSDLSHLLAGLGPATGLARMFRRLEHVVGLVIGLRVWPEVVGLVWGSVSRAVHEAGGWGPVGGWVRGWVGL